MSEKKQFKVVSTYVVEVESFVEARSPEEAESIVESEVLADGVTAAIDSGAVTIGETELMGVDAVEDENGVEYNT